MTAKEIIQKFHNNLDTFDLTVLAEFGYTENQIIHLMKEYATFCLEAQKNNFADLVRFSDDYGGKPVDYETILNTPITLL